MTKNSPRIAIFVDVQNIYYTTRQAFGRAFDYRRFWQQIESQGTITHAYAYAIARQDDGQRKFQDALRHIGFEVKLKPFIQRQDGSAKGDWDVGITIDVLDSIDAVDRIILLSGDGDFDLLLQAVRKRSKVKSEVYSVEALTAKSLIQAADQYHSILPSLLIN